VLLHRATTATPSDTPDAFRFTSRYISPHASKLISFYIPFVPHLEVTFRPLPSEGGTAYHSPFFLHSHVIEDGNTLVLVFLVFFPSFLSSSSFLSTFPPLLFLEQPNNYRIQKVLTVVCRRRPSLYLLPPQRSCNFGNACNYERVRTIERIQHRSCPFHHGLSSKVVIHSDIDFSARELHT